jgi:hypothetical protein
MDRAGKDNQTFNDLNSTICIYTILSQFILSQNDWTRNFTSITNNIPNFSPGIRQILNIQSFCILLRCVTKFSILF